LMTEADLLYAVSDHTIASTSEVFDKVTAIKLVGMDSCVSRKLEGTKRKDLPRETYLPTGLDFCVKG
jgi:hypothetical protein